MLIDSFTRFKITDPLEFYKTVGTESSVRNRLNSNVISSLRRVVGRVTLEELLSEERSNIMENIKVEVNNEASRLELKLSMLESEGQIFLKPTAKLYMKG